MRRELLSAVWLAGALHGQTVINGDRKILGKWDASVSTATLPFSIGMLAELPASCLTGQMYFATDAPPGRNVYGCAGNIWGALGYRQGTMAGMPAACAAGDLYFATDAAAGANLYACAPANTWTAMAGTGGGSGTVTHSAGALAAGAIVTGNGGGDTRTPNAGATVDGSGNIATPGALTTGSGGSASGSVALSGSVSGTVTQTVAPSAGTWTFQWPGAPAAARQWLTTDGAGAGTFTQPADADVAFSDVTTGNVSTAAHGYAPKAPNDATKYLNGTGAWSTPPGGMSNPMTAAGDLIVGGAGGAPTRLAASAGYPHWTGSAWQFDLPSGPGATIPGVTNLIAGSGNGNGADSGIAPADVALLNGGNGFTGYSDFSAGRLRVPEATFASQPGSLQAGQEFLFTDAAAAGTCAGGGSAKALCRWSGSAWEAIGGGSGGGGASYYQQMIGAASPGAGVNTTSRTPRGSMQIRDNLSFDDDGTNTILSFTTLDARVVNVDEEFFGASTTGWQYPWRQFNIAGSSTVNQVTGGDTWPNLGVIAATTGSTAGNGFSLAFTNNVGAAGTLGALGANAGWGYVWIFKLASTASARLRIGTGVIDSIATFDRGGMMGLRWDTNQGDTGNFKFFVNPTGGSNGGASDVTVDSGVAADSGYHTLLVYSTAAGTIRMSLDGAEKTFCAAGGGCDGTAVIPAAQMDPLAQLVTDTAASRTVYLDAFKFKARVSTSSANRRN
jgi:hypothetical protein